MQTDHRSPITDHRILALIGSNGMLAKMIRERAPQNYRLHLYDLPEFDVTDRDQVLQEMRRVQPDVIINCAAFTDVDGCETEVELANRVNGTAVGYLAEAAQKVDATLIHISTDYVFDGTKESPYVEEDLVNPQSAYGASKLLGEQAILDSGLKKYFIVRTSWLYGHGGKNFVETILRLAGEREELKVVADQVGSPTYTADLADAVFHLLALTDHRSPITGHDPYGTYHFSNEGHCSWYEFACAIVEEARRHNLPVVTRDIHPIRTEEYPLPAKRPANSMFDKSKYKAATGAEIPEWRESLRRYILSRDE
jgi:dTDP-4-dehydrorhamnose reductase